MILSLILVLLLLISIFFWSIREKILINPAFYFVFLVYFLQFGLIVYLDRYGELPLIVYEGAPYTIQENSYLICLSLAILSFICFVSGYLFKSKINPGISKSLTFPPKLSFGKIHPVLVVVFLFGGFSWLLGVQLSYGLGYYLQYSAQIRGNPDFETFSSTAFLIHLGRNISMIPMFLWFGKYAVHGKHGVFALTSVLLMMVMLYTSSGRTAFLITIILLILTWYGARGKRTDMVMLIGLVVFGLVIAVAGRTVLNVQSYVDGIASFSANVLLQLGDYEHSLERLSGFGISPLHLSFVVEDVGRRYDYFYFKDIPLIPLYIIPKMIHGMDPMVASIVFNDIYYPIRYGNAPPQFLAYLYWSLGLPGIIFGSLVVGYLTGVVRAWSFETARIPGFYGVAIFFSYQIILLSTGYMSGTVRPLLPYVVVIFGLICFSKVRFSSRLATNSKKSDSTSAA